VLDGLKADHRRASLAAHVIRPPIDPVQLPVVLQAERITGMPILGGNAVGILPSSPGFIDALIADVTHARRHVHMLFYIFEPDETGRRVADALLEAAARGVKCRLLADAAGSRHFFNGDMPERLRAGGVDVRPALPVARFRRSLARIDLRNHRKLAVIDASIAYTGSQNIVNPNFGHRRAGVFVDLMGRFRGPVVTQLQLAFLDDWYFETDEDLESDDYLRPSEPVGDVPAQAVPTGPGQETESLVKLILAALNAAQHRVIITSPYLVPDEPTTLALAMAVDRNVEVHIVVPECSDHPIVSCAGRWYYHQLLQAGCKIHLFRGGMLHSKAITVDDHFALLGSSNLDVRSFYLNFELNVVLYGPRITNELRAIQTQYIARSETLDPQRWRQRAVWKQYRDTAAALLTPLL
jgi:cardiolipin synthase